MMRTEIRRFARALIWGAVFCVLASGAQAAPVACSDPVFPGAASNCESVTRAFAASSSPTDKPFVFDSGLFVNHLGFDEVLHNISVTITAFFVDIGNSVFLSRLPGGYEPEGFVTSLGMKWIYFRVEGPPQSGVDYTGNWRQLIQWFGDGNYLNPQVLHDNRPLGNFSGTPITDPNNPFNPIGVPTDPTIGGTAPDFSDTMVVSQLIPEPGSMLLLGTGLGGLLYRRRRQRSAAARADSE